MERGGVHGSKLVPSKQTKDILIVEDDLDLLEVYRTILEADAWHVVTTVTCKDACLHLLGPNVPDIIVLDLGLPDCDGLEILETIRRGGILVHVIVVSACEEIQKAIECVRAGASEFLEKPVDPRSFLSVVNKYHNLQGRVVPGACDVSILSGGVRHPQAQVRPSPLPRSPLSPPPMLPGLRSPDAVVSRALLKQYFYISIAIVSLLFLAGAYGVTAYLEYQSDQQTALLKRVISQSTLSMRKSSSELKQIMHASGSQGVTMEHVVEGFSSAIDSKEGVTDIVKAINKYKKKKLLTKKKHFQQFYVTYFADRYWHVSPEAFLQGLRDAGVQDALIPGDRDDLVRIKQAHMMLLERFLKHINNTNYDNDQVPKRDRQFDTYRTEDDIDYGTVALSQKEKKKLKKRLKNLIETLKLKAGT